MSTNNTENYGVGDSESKILTPKEVLSITQRITNDQLVRVLDYHLDDYAKDKIGFTGSHRSLKITFQKSHADSAETVYAFVKGMPKYNVENEKQLYMPILKQESYFFEKILPELIQDYKSEKWCPTYYLTTENSIIIEDLKFSGYRMLKEFYDNPVILKSVLASLARFHSCSILAEARLSRQSKHPVTLSKYFKEPITELIFVQEGEKAHWYNCGINLTCDLAQRLGYNSKQIRSVFSRVFDIVKPSETYQNVICHGDLHMNNIMFADNLPLYRSILVDFQIIRYAPLVTDILQLLHLSASRKFREEFEEELIKFYHSVLVETIHSHDPKIEPPTLESIFKGLEDLRLYGLIVACIYVPLAMLSSKDNKKLMEDSRSLFNFLFGNRLELVLVHMKVDESYKNLVESAVVELAEKAVR